MSILITKYSDVIPSDVRSTISRRYKTVTKAINQEFWSSASDTLHSFYVGSYGRGTAVSTSDIDILIEIPKAEYNRYDNVYGNGQSRFLQAVKSSIQVSFPRSNVRADGQVVKINFSDGIYFEVLPAFKGIDWYGIESYTYPDTNMGGNWKSANPKAEQDEMKRKNNSSNGLLFDTCKHLRKIRDNYFSSYHLSGIVIDSFVYAAMGQWQWQLKGDSSSAAFGDYERVLHNYLHQSILSWPYNSLKAPGSGQIVDAVSSMECLNKVLNKIID